MVKDAGNRKNAQDEDPSGRYVLCIFKRYRSDLRMQKASPPALKLGKIKEQEHQNYDTKYVGFLI